MSGNQTFYNFPKLDLVRQEFYYRPTGVIVKHNWDTLFVGKAEINRDTIMGGYCMCNNETCESINSGPRPTYQQLVDFICACNGCDSFKTKFDDMDMADIDFDD